MRWLKRLKGFPAAIAVIGFVLLFLLAVALYAVGAPDSWARVVAVALVLGAASVAVGGLFGLLFGVPKLRVPSKDESGNEAAGGKADAAASDAGQPLFGMNTNLGEVSDWLTKILVGVGLTQIGNAGPAFATLSGAVGEPFGATGTGRVFAGSIVVFLAVFGFVAGWLCSVLILPSELSLAIERRARKAAVEAVERTADAVRDTALEYEREALDALQAALGPTPLRRGRGAGDLDARFKRGSANVVVEIRYRSKWLGRRDLMDLATRAPAGARLVVVAPGFSPKAREWMSENAERVVGITWRLGDDGGAFAEALATLT